MHIIINEAMGKGAAEKMETLSDKRYLVTTKYNHLSHIVYGIGIYTASYCYCEWKRRIKRLNHGKSMRVLKLLTFIPCDGIKHDVEHFSLCCCHWNTEFDDFSSFILIPSYIAMLMYMYQSELIVTSILNAWSCQIHIKIEIEINIEMTYSLGNVNIDTILDIQ